MTLNARRVWTFNVLFALAFTAAHYFAGANEIGPVYVAAQDRKGTPIRGLVSVLAARGREKQEFFAGPRGFIRLPEGWLLLSARFDSPIGARCGYCVFRSELRPPPPSSAPRPRP